MLLPLINDSCAEGTIFCSDGWKAYLKLNENVDLDDTLHFAVNHSENYVDPTMVPSAQLSFIRGSNIARDLE